MSSASDQDMSECSNSPTYTTLESPQSSPLQQVPQFTTKLNSHCTDQNLYNSTNNGNEPFLKVIEQPQKYFRFRYNTEKAGSTHGGILGKSCVDSKTKKKTHPTVELVNFVGEAVIRCSVKYESQKNIHKKIYKILEDVQTIKTCKGQANGNFKVVFPGISIVTYTRIGLTDLLYNKLLEVAKKNSANTSELRTQCGNWAKDLDQNVVRLKFTAHDMDTGKEICPPVLSEPIFNKKSPATNALKIFRTSACSGRVSGGEDLFLLVDKIDKNETRVRFYEVDQNGKKVWSQWAHFGPSDVHYQCAIVCRTPPYKNRETSVNVNVFIELVRTSNGSTSDPWPFCYIADPVYKYGIKKRKIAAPCTSRSESSFSSESWNLEQAPVIVLQNNPNEFMSETVAPQLTLTTSENQWMPISSRENILNEFEPQELSPMWGPCYMINPIGNSAQMAVHKPAEISFAATHTQPTSVKFSSTTLPSQTGLGSTTLSTGVGTAEVVFAGDPTQSCSVEHIVSAPLYSNSAELCTAPIPAPSSEQSSDDVLIEENLLQDIESDLMEAYADVFGLTFDYSSLNKKNDLVGDSGRVKEIATSTSSTQTADAAGTEHAICDNNDVLHYQGAYEEILHTRANEGELTGQNADESKITAREVVGEAAKANKNQSSIDKDAQKKDKVVLDKTSKDSYEVVEPQMDTTPHTINQSELLRATMQNKNRLLLSKEIVEEYWLPNSEEAKGIDLSLASEMSQDIGTFDNEGSKVRTKFSSAGQSNEAGGAGHSKNTDKGTSTVADAAEASGSVNITGLDLDYPFFNAKDEAEVKKIVRDLCQKTRDKKISKSELAIKLNRLFDIRLSNGDTFLHMTFFKSQRSCETLIKMIYSVKMYHLLNYGNYRGETILHLAVAQGTPEFVSLLVAKGCDPMAHNCENETAVHYAVRYASAETLKALLDAAQRAGAKLDLDAGNAERQSALHLCVVENRPRCAALLCEAGAGCGAQDAAGRTPLHLCAYDAKINVARALLPHALPHLDALDAAGRTPLAVACECAPTSHTLQLVQVLLEAGASADLAWAASRKHLALAELLRAYMRADMLQDDFKSETDTDEYESADDEYIDDSSPEYLPRKVAQMALTDGEALNAMQ